MRRREVATWVAVGSLALAVRTAYVAAQARLDPTFARPMLDESVYVAWAQALAAGSGQPAGAFYLAPLYPNLLALWVSGGGHFSLLYVAQQGLAIAAAAALAWTARRMAGPAAGLAAGLLALTYHPLLFFAGRPLGETVAVALLAFALAAGTSFRGPGLLSGVLLGLSTLARPNLAPAVLAWSAGTTRRRALLMLAGAAAVVAPVTLRNYAASGHVVPVSSNGGITLYHGNGPGALGIFTPVEELSGRVDRQREEAARAASKAEGRPLDPVEADGWWGRRALQVRLADLPDTGVLLARRLALLASTREIGLDAAPSLDENPWRFAAPLPFAALLALAAAGLAGLGWTRTGGWLLWGTVATCAAMPLIFYVSSRYRLPLAAVLAVPAGIGLAGTLDQLEGFRRRPALLAGLGALAVSLLVPTGSLARACDASALSNRAAAWLQAGDLDRAAADVRRALALDAAAAPAWFNAGLVAERRQASIEAETAYRRALALQPSLGDAAGNLGGLLVRLGRTEEAVRVLEEGVTADPAHPVCWTNLIVALMAGGRMREAGAAAERARAAGVRVDPGLLAAVEAGGRS